MQKGGVNVSDINDIFSTLSEVGEDVTELDENEEIIEYDPDNFEEVNVTVTEAESAETEDNVNELLDIDNTEEITFLPEEDIIILDEQEDNNLVSSEEPTEDGVDVVNFIEGEEPNITEEIEGDSVENITYLEDDDPVITESASEELGNSTTENKSEGFEFEEPTEYESEPIMLEDTEDVVFVDEDSEGEPTDGIQTVQPSTEEVDMGNLTEGTKAVESLTDSTDSVADAEEPTETDINAESTVNIESDDNNSVFFDDGSVDLVNSNEDLVFDDEEPNTEFNSVDVDNDLLNNTGIDLIGDNIEDLIEDVITENLVEGMTTSVIESNISENEIDNLLSYSINPDIMPLDAEEEIQEGSPKPLNYYERNVVEIPSEQIGSKDYVKTLYNYNHLYKNFLDSLAKSISEQIGINVNDKDLTLFGYSLALEQICELNRALSDCGCYDDIISIYGGSVPDRWVDSELGMKYAVICRNVALKLSKGEEPNKYEKENLIKRILAKRIDSEPLEEIEETFSTKYATDIDNYIEKLYGNVSANEVGNNSVVTEMLTGNIPTIIMISSLLTENLTVELKFENPLDSLGLNFDFGSIHSEEESFEDEENDDLYGDDSDEYEIENIEENYNEETDDFEDNTLDPEDEEEVVINDEEESDYLNYEDDDLEDNSEDDEEEVIINEEDSDDSGFLDYEDDDNYEEEDEEVFIDDEDSEDSELFEYEDEDEEEVISIDDSEEYEDDEESEDLDDEYSDEEDEEVFINEEDSSDDEDYLEDYDEEDEEVTLVDEEYEEDLEDYDEDEEDVVMVDEEEEYDEDSEEDEEVIFNEEGTEESDDDLEDFLYDEEEDEEVTFNEDEDLADEDDDEDYFAEDEDEEIILNDEDDLVEEDDEDYFEEDEDEEVVFNEDDSEEDYDNDIDLDELDELDDEEITIVDDATEDDLLWNADDDLLEEEETVLADEEDHRGEVLWSADDNIDTWAEQPRDTSRLDEIKANLHKRTAPENPYLAEMRRRREAQEQEAQNSVSSSSPVSNHSVNRNNTLQFPVDYRVNPITNKLEDYEVVAGAVMKGIENVGNMGSRVVTRITQSTQNNENFVDTAKNEEP